MRIFTAIVVVALSTLIGCGDSDKTKTYTVPKADDAKPVDAAAAGVATPGNFRIVGAIFPSDEPQWFFKLGGKSDALTPYVADLEKMFKTVRFPKGLKELPEWDLPAGWKNAGENRTKMAAETIQFGPADSPFLMTVTPAMGGMTANVARWAGQVGVKNFAPEKMGLYAKDIEAKNVKGLMVDMSGPNNPGMSPRPPMMPK